MYCALDKIDLAATVEGRKVCVQTDHRTFAEIDDTLALSILFALARVINARQDGAQVHYIVARAPAAFLDALAAAGAVVSDTASQLPAIQLAGDDDLVDELVDDAFRELAARTAAIAGTRDVAIALRMLEDQTLAAPPTAVPERWRRVLELAALAGELLRARFPGAHWAISDRALVPFGVSLPLAAGNSTTVFPTNRAQRLIDDGRDHSLFGLLAAAEEAPLDHGRLMPSLRLRDNAPLDELVWRTLWPDAPRELPIVICGIDGENVFGMIHRDALTSVETAWTEALANLAEEKVELRVSDRIVVVSGSFYAAEKLLDREQLRAIHDHTGARVLLAATPARGGLLLAPSDDGIASRFASLVRTKYEAAGNRAISPVVWLVEDGEITGLVSSTRPARAESVLRAKTSPLKRRK